MTKVLIKLHLLGSPKTLRHVTSFLLLQFQEENTTLCDLPTKVRSSLFMSTFLFYNTKLIIDVGSKVPSRSLPQLRLRRPAYLYGSERMIWSKTREYILFVNFVSALSGTRLL